MTVFTMNDINKKLTVLVQKYLNMGYYIYINAMGVSLSKCTGRIILYNGKEFVNVHIDNTVEFDACAGKHKNIIREGYQLVEEYYGKEYPHWNNKGKILSKLTFFEIGRKKKAFVSTEEEWVEAKKKSIDRMYVRNWDYRPTKQNIKFNPDTVVRIVRSKEGFKSCRKSQITEVQKVVGLNRTPYYRIIIQGKDKPSTRTIVVG